MFQFIFGVITSIPWAIEELVTLIGEGLYYGAGALAELLIFFPVFLQMIAAFVVGSIIGLF